MLLWKVIIITAGFQTIMNLTRPIITLYALDMGASTLDIGFLTAAYAFFPLLFAIHAGRVADHVGDRLPTFLGLIGISIGMAIPYLFPTIAALYASQFIVGIANVFITVSLQNILGNSASDQNRDYYFSMYALAVAIGALIGPVIGGYLAEYISYSSAFFVSIIINFLPIVLSLFIPVIRKQKDIGRVKISSSLSLLKMPILRKALLTSALVLYSKDIFVAYFPLFAKHNDISESVIGWIIATQGLATIAVRLFLTKLIYTFGRDLVLLASVCIAGIAFLLVPLTSNVLLYFILSGLMGLGLGCGQPLSMATTYNASPISRTGEVLGLRLAGNRLSQLIAPVFFGLVGTWAGVISVFYVSGTLLLGGIFVIRPRKQGEETGGRFFRFKSRERED
ncbi:MAG TPA: MFS transporter [Bacillus sp. (in: firmicutes)]|uniref:MFS transporter n=1 Tax=Bacillus litorisediminis TaxID=2922713 RepID=UPI001FB04925|nr:MFS transporter [Bacillus litorisediminis]HWO76121.1 MFS transporter [Bacillus sp. (in: firmicutes)]